MLTATATASRSNLFSSTGIDGFARRRASDVSRAPARVARSPRRRAMDANNEDDSALASSSSSQRWESPGYETLRLLVPELDSSRYHKGQAGKIGVVGGCSEYTGAPYFAAMSALRMGADLAHVFCAEGAGQVIKSYSPELIVHPYLREGRKEVTVTVDGGEAVHAVTYDEEAVFEAMERVTPWLHRMDALVVGPGLGRDPTMSEIAKRIIAFAHERDVPLVIDADGLRVLMEDQGLIREGHVVLTPNKAELDRFSAQIAGSRGDPPPTTTIARARYVTSQLDGPVVVAKGEADIVALDVIVESTDGAAMPYRRHLVCDEPGSPRRCGGQGDVLAGAIAVFLAWATRSKEAECAVVRRIAGMDADVDADMEDLIANAGEGPDFALHPSLASAVSVVAAYAGCLVTRVAARAAFGRKRRSMLATDVIEELGDTMQRLFPVYADEG